MIPTKYDIKNKHQALNEVQCLMGSL